MKRTALALALAAVGLSAQAEIKSCNYPIPDTVPPGRYELWLFGDDTTQKYYGSTSVEIGTQSMISAGPAIASGGTITVNWNSLISDPHAWVALYVPGSGATNLINWAYINTDWFGQPFFCTPASGPNESRIFNNAAGQVARILSNTNGQPATLEFRYSPFTARYRLGWWWDSSTNENACNWVDGTNVDLTNQASVMAFAQSLKCQP